MFSHRKIIYILICLGNITISFNIAAITAAVPAISLDLHQPDFLVSKIISYYLIPYGIGALIYAPLTRYISYRSVLSFVMAGYAVSSFVCGMGQSLNALLMARVAMGITAAGAIPLGLMVIGEFFEKSVRGRLVGGFFSCSFFASLAGVMLGGLMHWRWIFYVPAMLGALMALSFFIFGKKNLRIKHEAPVNYLHIFNKTSIRNIFIFIFILSALYHGVHKWFGVYLDRFYQMDKLTISFFFILAAIGGFIGQHVGGYLSDKKSRLVSCYVGLVGLGITTMLLAGHYSLTILGIIFITLSMFWTIGHNGISTVLTDFPDEDRPLIASLNSSVRFIGGGVGFYVSSFFVKKNFGLTFFYIGILMLFIIIMLNRIFKKGN
ncbi:Cysteine desulfurase [hydrothermal vent metagenome]|uniref:Cysteine desulfurase n=1 Tax=hydrothermal vent metagenome TaxID=652676 RepID=A0A3B1DG26_9ZZZZ